MKEAVNHAIAEAMSILSTELADCLGFDEVELEWELERDDNIKELTDKLRAAIQDKAQSVLDSEVEKAQELLEEEWAYLHLPIVKEEYEQDGVVDGPARGVVDGPARREDWCNFIDAKCRNGDITEVIAGLVDADVESL
jgi:hypothetical protein